MYRYLKVFSLFLFVCFIQTAQSEKCHKLFQTLNTDEVQSFFSDPANYNKYKGQEGYALFAKDHYTKDHYKGDMLKAFLNVSSVLSESEFKELGWQEFHGSEVEFS